MPQESRSEDDEKPGAIGSAFGLESNSCVMEIQHHIDNIIHNTSTESKELQVLTSSYDDGDKTYPKGFKLFSVILALALSIFLIAIVSVL